MELDGLEFWLLSSLESMNSHIQRITKQCQKLPSILLIDSSNEITNNCTSVSLYQGDSCHRLVLWEEYTLIKYLSNIRHTDSQSSVYAFRTNDMFHDEKVELGLS